MYRYQLGTCNIDAALVAVVFAVANEQKNCFFYIASNICFAVTPSGKVNQVSPGGATPFIFGVEIKVFIKKLKLLNNRRIYYARHRNYNS